MSYVKLCFEINDEEFEFKTTITEKELQSITTEEADKLFEVEVFRKIKNGHFGKFGSGRVVHQYN